jgi:H+/Cl- antiporter ClcA
LGLAGSYNYFGNTSLLPLTVMDWALVPICGIAGGALGAAFSGLALHFGQRLRLWIHSNPFRRSLSVAGACGLAVAVIGVVSDGLTFGTSYDQARSAIAGEHLPLMFFAEKCLATFASMLSGIPGGIFAPSLSVGAGLGSSIGTILGASIGLAAILGMAGYFSGVVQAPMTAFVIIIEMTGDHQAVIPIMATAMIGFLTSRILSREPLYHGLSRTFIAAAIRARRASEKMASF